MTKPTTTPPEQLYPLILDSIDQGAFTVDADFVITSFNAAAERIIGVRRDEAIGRRCYHVFRASICESGCALRRTLATGEHLRDVRIDVLNSEMEAVPISVSTAVVRDREGRLLGGVELFRDLSELEALRRLVSAREGAGDMVGDSAPMRRLLRLLPDLADADAPVLIEGPSGSGKELVAAALHRLSPRAEGPFVRINCGALPDTLLESELFGYVKGAFTDARRDKPGRFVQAHRGTILLDEIGDVSPAFQVKLLRVLQEGEVEPLGATEPVSVDVRVLAATNRDLAALVADGAFRQDLYYRLRVLPVQVPALVERLDDVPLLVSHFLQTIAARRGRPVPELSPEAAGLLSRHDYPGNVRELRNILERAFVLAQGGRIEPEHLPPELSGVPPPGGARLKPSERRILGRDQPPSTSTARLTPPARRLVEALDAHGWNRTRTAAALGIARNTLWRRMRDYGLLDRPES